MEDNKSGSCFGLRSSMLHCVAWFESLAACLYYYWCTIGIQPSPSNRCQCQSNKWEHVGLFPQQRRKNKTYRGREVWISLIGVPFPEMAQREKSYCVPPSRDHCCPARAIEDHVGSALRWVHLWATISGRRKIQEHGPGIPVAMSESTIIFNGWQSWEPTFVFCLPCSTYVSIASKSFANATLMIDMNNWLCFPQMWVSTCEWPGHRCKPIELALSAGTDKKRYSLLRISTGVFENQLRFSRNLIDWLTREVHPWYEADKTRQDIIHANILQTVLLIENGRAFHYHFSRDNLLWCNCGAVCHRGEREGSSGSGNTTSPDKTRQPSFSSGVRRCAVASIRS